jgi:hypothetical protein
MCCVSICLWELRIPGNTSVSKAMPRREPVTPNRKRNNEIVNKLTRNLRGLELTADCVRSSRHFPSSETDVALSPSERITNHAKLPEQSS